MALPNSVAQVHGSVLWLCAWRLRSVALFLGAGVDFPKSFKKFALLAKKKKFPEISLASGLGQRISPKFPALRGLPPLHAS